MSELDDLIAEAVEHDDLPFAVGMVADRGGVLWQGAAGRANAGHAADSTTLFRLFSMTKAITALGALVLVDRGQLSLETPVASVLPEFDDLRVVDSAGPDGVVLRKPRTQATLRHLMTHTVGFAYASANATMAAYARQVPDLPSIREGTLISLNFPLMFDPGEGWTYGIGPDWVGRMVSAVDGRPIDRFYQEEVLDPLGLKETLFEVGALRERLADVHRRESGGEFVAVEHAPPSHPEVYGMGQALYGTAADYVRFLRMVLNGGELDGLRLVRPETFELYLTNQIGDVPIGPLPATMPHLSAEVDLFPGTRKSHTAGFMRFEEGIPGMRAAGSLGWAGVLNTHYWIDRKNDVAAVLMTQSLPFCEPRFMRVWADFERAVYRTELR
jgi:methyl acetate hydrolase